MQCHDDAALVNIHAADAGDVNGSARKAAMLYRALTPPPLCRGMYHDPSLAAAAKADPRPRSAVSAGVGLAGLAGILIWTGIARWFGMDGPYSAITNLICAAVPMLVWSLFVDKVHRRASTGLDWSVKRCWRETRETSLTKLAGLWATWTAIALVYGVFRFYWTGNYLFAMKCLTAAAPVVFVLSGPYVLWLDRFMVEPRDGAWHLGAWLTGQAGAEPEAIHGHLRSWAVKGFYLAFMLSIVPPGFGAFVRWRAADLHDPAAIALWLVTFMFTIDVALATVGYVFTMRPLDAHIRSASPFASGWGSALLCYPPFILMSEAGPLNYFPGTRGPDGWSAWFAGHPVVLALWGAVLVALTAIYAWATMAFGLRFSNLTHRGILTHGPYAISRHPAYLSKNLFWWLSVLPVLSVANVTDAARATLLMAVVSGVYYWRAKTEEAHLGLDPAYQEYSAWMTRRGAVPRFFRWARRSVTEL